MNAQRAVLSAALLLCLLVAGCGGGDSSKPTGSSTGSAPTATTTTGGSAETVDDDLRRAFDRALLALLTDQQGLSGEQARCAVDELTDSVTDAELAQGLVALRETGEPPQGLVDEAFDAGARCAGG